MRTNSPQFLRFQFLDFRVVVNQVPSWASTTQKMFGYFASWSHVDKLQHLPFLPGLDEIRLLELSTATSGRLFNVPRNSTPQYFAISYAWGDPTPVAPYTINNKQKILIPRSLSQALARVFKYISKSSTGEVYIWADALCINQDDNDEKAAQVAHMSSIYRRAARVLVYLGEDGYGNDSKAAIRDISSWGHRNDEQFGRSYLWHSDDHFRSLTGNPNLNNFFRRPWWNRMWTIQEVTTSPSDRIIVLSGAHEIKWSTLLSAVGFWLDRERIDGRLGGAVNDTISEFLKGGLAAKKAINASGWRKQEWLAVLAASASLASLDPRDKIYALVSICPPLPGFAISYQKPVPQVFQEFTKAMIQHYNNLDILQLAGVNHEPAANPHNLASWIPNFEKLDHPVLPYRNMIHTKHCFDQMSTSFKVWNASPLPHCLEPATDVSDFRPTGVQVGTIDEVLLPQPGVRGDPGWLRAAHRRWGTKYDTPTLQCHILQAYFRTMLGDYYPNARQKLLSYSGKFSLAGTFWHKHRIAMAPLLQKMDLSAGLDEILLGQKGQLQVQFGDFDHEVTRATVDKWGSLHFFMTSNGYMGYGPSCQPNDVVCIIFGCNVPLVLRPQGGGFVILGQCFVLGVMDGELFKDERLDTDLEGQVFDIL